MIRTLFVYRYCTMGGVETGLRFRIDSLSKYGVETHGLFLRDYGGRASFADLDGRVFFSPTKGPFVEVVKDNGYDLISVIDSFDVLEWLDSMNFEGKILVELRSTYEHTLVQLKRLADHRLHAILVPSRFQSENIQKYLPRKVRENIPCYTVYNFVDPEKFRRQSTIGPGYGRRIVCWVGRIDPLKNWPDFLAIADLLSDRRDVEFWMVGGGGSDVEARKQFRQALGKTRLASRLRWWPLLPNTQMPLLYTLVAESGGLVLLTSKCESFGFAALEALACQCPLVAAEVGALPEIIEHQVTGLFYPPGDVREAVQCVSRLLNDDVCRRTLASNAARSVGERFSPDRCAAGFADVIRTVVGPSVASAPPSAGQPEAGDSSQHIRRCNHVGR